MSKRYLSNEDFIRYALDCAAIVATTNSAGEITFVNKKFCEISGYSKEELVGSNHRIVNSGAHGEDFFRQMYSQISNGLNWHGEICNRRKDGSLYWVDTTIVPHVSKAGKVDGYTAIRFDITDRKTVEKELRSANQLLDDVANIDALTGTPNRRKFGESIEKILASANQASPPFYLGLMDVDSFKDINDAFGHDIGDAVMQEMASRLLASVGDECLIARVGGDEFGFILSGVDDENALKFFDGILDTIREPIDLGKSSRNFPASLGVAKYPDHGSTYLSLFKAADIALYHAKKLGKDRVEYFDEELRYAVDRKFRLISGIQMAIENEEFKLFYQPVVPVRSTLPFSVEALLRWQHPVHGVLSPDSFRDGFDDKPTAAALGLYILEQVFRDAETLRAAGVELGKIAINLSNADFRTDQFIERFFELSRQTGIAANQFCVEVTEGMFLGRDHQRVHQSLQQLHDAGVMVALDDFGTGYASLTHLRQLPIDRIKIDKSFVERITSNCDDQFIVKGIIDVSHKLGKTVVAEGVENLDQANLLIKMDCDFLQGWYFSKAKPVDILPSILEEIRTERAVLVT